MTEHGKDFISSCNISQRYLLSSVQNIFRIVQRFSRIKTSMLSSHLLLFLLLHPYKQSRFMINDFTFSMNKHFCLIMCLLRCIIQIFLDEQIVCAKVREGDQRIVRIKEGDPSGRHVVIVDDLVQSGGTLIECQVSKCERFMTIRFTSFCICHMDLNLFRKHA